MKSITETRGVSEHPVRTEDADAEEGPAAGGGAGGGGQRHRRRHLRQAGEAARAAK